MSEKELTRVELLKKAQEIKKQMILITNRARQLEEDAEHDRITPEEEDQKFAELFEKMVALNAEKTVVMEEALKNDYQEITALLKCAHCGDCNCRR